MDILPAIDLRNGKCVRLIQGDYNRQIDYSGQPVEQAQEFENQGAQWLHVVDLDGARDGKMNNLNEIGQIVSQTGLRVEVGGGVRDERAIDELLQVGVERVIVGTRALEDINWFERLVNIPRYAHKIVLGLDARNGKLATRGWLRDSEFDVADIIRKVDGWPLAAIVYTDIARDGMLTGPNVELTATVARNSSIPVIASGGVGKLSHIKQLCQLPISGIIVGRALYERAFTLSEALQVSGS